MAYYIIDNDSKVVSAWADSANANANRNGGTVVEIDGPVGDTTNKVYSDGALVTDTVELAASIRVKRDGLLRASDHTQVTDVPESSLQSTKAEWATYRQALRDIPSQSGFPNTVVWPTII